MKKIAIDVVLLLPREVKEAAIELNRQLTGSAEKKIILDEEKCLPHISLAMGVVREEDLPTISELLRGIADQCTPLQLTATGVLEYEIKPEEYGAELKIEGNDALKQLHEGIMRALEPYLESEATIDMLYSPPKVDEISLSWIRKYKEKWSFEKFYPHITLGIGRTDQRNISLSFVVSELALCHLGNYCTCRRILYSSSLGKPQNVVN